MVFMVILTVIAVVVAVGLLLYAFEGDGDVRSVFGGVASLVVAITLAICTPVFWNEAKVNKALIQAHLENPTNFTYTQLAEHNELVTKLGVWHGTIFSFYNDVDLKTIDIDSVSQKVLVEQDEEK
jgi:hypothetical protein